MSGTEQLLFSFMVPSTLSTTSNIHEIQKLVSLGCSKLHRKLLFADSLAKLPYKIGEIREILSSMITLTSELQYTNQRSGLVRRDLRDISLVYSQLQESTHNLCRGERSLPVLAVELQNNCHLLQVRTDKDFTVNS